MIERENMFEPLLAAHPKFEPQYLAFMQEWKNEEEGPPFYLLLADLARECSRLMRDQEVQTLVAIFGVVERWIREGDDYVSEAAIVGFIEDFQKPSFHERTKPADFKFMMGPESLYWWNKVERFWSNGEMLIDERTQTEKNRLN